MNTDSRYSPPPLPSASTASAPLDRASWGAAMHGLSQDTDRHAPNNSPAPPPTSYSPSSYSAYFPSQQASSTSDHAYGAYGQASHFELPAGQIVNCDSAAPFFDRTAAETRAANTRTPWHYGYSPIAIHPDSYRLPPGPAYAPVNGPSPHVPATTPASAFPTSAFMISPSYAATATTAAAGAAAPPASGAKRRGRPRGKGNKKQKTTDTRATERDVPGVGPRDGAAAPASGDAGAVLHPTLADKRFTSLVTRESGGGRVGASDVYYFLFGGLEWDSPLEEVFANGKLSVKRPSDKIYKTLVCRLCHPRRWQWKNTPNQTNCIRFHLRTHHFTTWRGVVLALRLKGWNEPVGGRNSSGPLEMAKKFHAQQLSEYIVDWVAAEDMSLNVLESPYLRRVLLYAGQGGLDETDIPHRTKLAELMLKRFELKHEEIRIDISASLGRVAFTMDIWSRQNLESYMAVTAHYIVRCVRTNNWTLRARLIAFRYLPGNHSGEKIAEIFLHILGEVNCEDNTSLITADNASPNDTALQFLERWLRDKGIEFDSEGNRVCCFPHVVNIGAQAGVEILKKPTLCLEFGVQLPAELLADAPYYRALEEDVIGGLRRIANWIRVSEGRRKDLKAIIHDGNAAGRWLTPAREPETIPPLAVLRDVDTRWSSIFLMVDRVLVLYRPIDELLHLKKYADTEAPDLALSKTQLDALEDARLFLSVLHMAQEMVSGQKTPTLAYVLPAYALLIETLNDLKIKLPKISHAIGVTKKKLEFYMDKALNTEAYAISMILNPMIKFEWVRKHGQPGDLERHHEFLYKAMLKHRQYARKKGVLQLPQRPGAHQISAQHISLSRGPCAPQTGLGRLASFRRELAKSTSHSSMGDPDGGAESGEQLPSLDPNAAEVLAEARQHEQDLVAIKDEVARYEQAGIIDDEHPLANDFDLLRFWQSNQGTYPGMVPVALDILPVQASAVPCERVFSSSKETDTDRRSKLDPVMMETLQILKYALKDELDFTEGLLATEEECAALTVDSNLVQQLLEENKIAELVELFESAQKYDTSDNMQAELTAGPGDDADEQSAAFARAAEEL